MTPLETISLCAIKVEVRVKGDLHEKTSANFFRLRVRATLLALCLRAPCCSDESRGRNARFGRKSIDGISRWLAESGDRGPDDGLASAQTHGFES